MDVAPTCPPLPSPRHPPTPSAPPGVPPSHIFPEKGGCMAFAPALDLTTSLRGDFMFSHCHLRSIPQGMMVDVYSLVKSLFCKTK